MAALGFNLVRLPISWSVLEPERGRFNDTFLDRIAQIVDWARALRMYVIVDMHQTAFPHYVGTGEGVDLRYNSGAPRWATIPDGFPSHVYEKQREINPAVFESTTNFWYDRDGIQDEFIAALAVIAHRFRDESVVVGYGVYNEPLLGWNLPPGFEDLLLFPFYRRVIDAITGVRDGLPCWSGVFMPAVCGYRDLGIHDVRHLMFLDTGLLREVERPHAGFAFWTWKEKGDAHSWGLFAPPNPTTTSSGCIREQRERLLARVYPRVTADPTLTYHYDPSDGRFALNARGLSGDSTTVVYVPREVTGQISSDGAVRIVVSDETDGR